MSFKTINPNEANTDFIKKISEEWLLITAKKPDGKINTMTASWGGIGFMWNKPVCLCVIRPQRYTHEFADAASRITMSFLDSDMHKALEICGKESGRNCDKISLAGLHPIQDGDIAYFEESSIVYVGRKIYVGKFEENNFIDKSIIGKCYPKSDFHDVYVCEIEKILIKE